MKKYVEYIITTDLGKFMCRFTPLFDTRTEDSVSKLHKQFDRNTNEPMSYVISLGSKEKFCVQLTIPSKESGLTEGHLLWVEANENCSLERYIKSGISKHMVLLGLRLSKDINPNITKILLEDTSSFHCKLPNNTTIKVPMKPFYIAFHGATWYEYYFGAKLQHDHEKYKKLKENMYKSENKPKIFNFINEELQEELEPLYETSINWYDFFQAISKKYGDKKCGMIYPWITPAMGDIAGYHIHDTRWYIDFMDNDVRQKVPIIQYKLTTIIQGGAKRKTAKKRKNRRFTFSRTHMFPNIPEIQAWNYRGFIL